jgi:HK97 family phage major capsid protein
LPGWPAAGGDSLSDDLRRHIFEAMYAVPPGLRQGAHWVMSGEWYLECRKMTDPGGFPLWVPSLRTDGPDVLLGMPIEVREGAGPPHLEPVTSDVR